MSISYYVYGCACMSVYYHHLHDSTHSDQKRVLDSLVTEDCELLDVGAGH